MATVTHSIGATGRDYTTPANWEADLDNDTPFDAGDDAVGECYNDSAFTDDEFVMNGGGTLGLNSVTFTVASGERHDGTAGTGARMVFASGSDQIGIDVQAPDIFGTVGWIEIDGAGTNQRAGLLCTKNPNQAFGTEIHHVLVHDINGVKFEYGIRNANRQTTTIHNCIVYALVGNGARTMVGIDSNSTWNTEIYNCTVHGIVNNSASNDVYGFGGPDDAGHLYKNNCAFGTGGTSSGTLVDYELSAPVSATYTTNASSDTTAVGTGLDSLTDTDQFVSVTDGSEDFHLKSGSDLIDAGTDLGAVNAAEDIDGRNRDTEGDTWDVGADEFVAAGGDPGESTSGPILTLMGYGT